LPARSPNLNAHAERWVRSVKNECLSKIIPFGERSLRRAMKDHIAHYHTERNHQGKNNLLLFQRMSKTDYDKPVRVATGWADFCDTIIKRQRNSPSGCSFIDAGRLMTGGYNTLTIRSNARTITRANLHRPQPKVLEPLPWKVACRSSESDVRR
jgi:hypothetical protein